MEQTFEQWLASLTTTLDETEKRVREKTAELAGNQLDGWLREIAESVNRAHNGAEALARCIADVKQLVE